MSLTTRVGLLGGVAVLTISGGSFAVDPAADATNQELRSRINELESRLAAVEAQDGQDWLTEQRASEIRNLIQERGVREQMPGGEPFDPKQVLPLVMAGQLVLVQRKR